MSKRTCSLGDGKPVVGRGWCRKHYTAWSRHGDPLYGEHLPPVGSGGIYSITCLTNGWVYIGETASLRQRWSNHRSHLRTGRHKVHRLQADHDQYGMDSLVFEVVSIIADQQERWAAETEHIAAARATGKCYNPSGGHFGEAYELTPEQRQRLSEAMTGKPKSAEHRANLWQDRAVTGEFRETMAANGRKLKGVGKSDETRLRMSAAQANRVLLTEPQVREIKRLLAADELTGGEIGRMFGVGRSAICAIKSGRTWSHVTLDEPAAVVIPPPSPVPAGEQLPMFA